MRQIQDYLGFQLLQIHKAHRARAEAALNKLGLHTGQEMLLLRLWIEEGIPQSQLAASMGVEPPTATKMLQRMEHTGLIERRPDPEDARISRVYLTERGRALEQPVLELWKQLEAHTVAGLQPRSRRSYAACLCRCLRIFPDTSLSCWPVLLDESVALFLAISFADY